MTDIYGPASADDAVTQRPSESRIFGDTDSWFKDCSTPSSDDGTETEAAWFNQVTAVLRSLARVNGLRQDGLNPVVPYDQSDLMALRGLQHLVQRGLLNSAIDSGSPNNAVATLQLQPAELVPGLEVSVQMAAPPTGPATLIVSGFAAVPIKRRGAMALVGNEWAAGDWVRLKLTSTGYFQIAGLAASDVVITTALTRTVGAAVGVTADFPDIIAAFAWLSNYRIGATGSVLFQCLGGKVVYNTKAAILAHPDIQRVKVLGAPMLAPMLGVNSWACTGYSAAQRFADAGTNLATLRSKFATEWNFLGGGGVTIQGPIGGFDGILLTGDGTGSGQGTAPLSGIGLGLAGNAVVANSLGVAVFGFAAGLFFRSGAAIVGDPAAGTAGALIALGNTGDGFQFTAGGAVTVLAYPTAYLGAYGNGGNGFTATGAAGVQATNCGLSHARGNAGRGWYSIGSGFGNFQNGSLFSYNGSHGAQVETGSSFTCYGGTFSGNGGSGIASITGPASCYVGSSTFGNNVANGLNWSGSGWCNAGSSAFSGNGSVAVYASYSGRVQVQGSTGIASNTSPALNTSGNNEAFIIG